MKPLQGPAKAERRRLKRQAEREAIEYRDREWNQRLLGELVNSMLEEDAERERLDAEGRAAYHSTYRPDETDDQWATDWDRDFATSTREWERGA